MKKKIKLTFAKCIAVAGDFHVYDREFEPGTKTKSFKGKWAIRLAMPKFSMTPKNAHQRRSQQYDERRGGPMDHKVDKP